MAAGEAFDVMFTDVSMPGPMNGFALARWMREARPDVGIIVTSGFVNVAELPAFLAEGGTFLPKPFSYDDLLAQVQRLTAHRTMQAKEA